MFGLRLRFRCCTLLVLPVAVYYPLTPRPLSPCGGEGGIAGDAAVALQCCVGWACCGVLPPHPRPLSPCGGEERIAGAAAGSEPAAVEEAAGGGGEQELVTER